MKSIKIMFSKFQKKSLRNVGWEDSVKMYIKYDRSCTKTFIEKRKIEIY
jgi:hypothetical protein